MTDKRYIAFGEGEPPEPVATVPGAIRMLEPGIGGFRA